MWFSCCFILLTFLKFLIELDESVLDGLGILPQRKQHKKLLLVCATEFFAVAFRQLLFTLSIIRGYYLHFKSLEDYDEAKLLSKIQCEKV